MFRAIKSQQGALMLSAAILIVFVAFLVAMITAIFVTGARKAANQVDHSQSFYIAQAGIERGVLALLTPEFTSPAVTNRIACANFAGTPALQNVAFADGVFSLSSTVGSPYYPVVTPLLSAAITSTDTTIPVDSLAGLSPEGRVRIDREEINYQGTSTTNCGAFGTPCLTNVVRGADGTNAKAHTVNAPVTQYQCNIESEAGIPDLTTPRAKSVMQRDTELQFGLLVGDDNGGERLYAWNSKGLGAPNNWSRFPVSAPVLDIDYNAVSVISYNDAWAVGDRTGGDARFVHYSNGTWTPSSAVQNTTLRGIYCISHDDCFAVGNSFKIFHYNGANWTQAVDLGDGVFRGVSCVHDASLPAPSYRCVAVGYVTTGGANNRARAYRHNSSQAVGTWTQMPTNGPNGTNGAGNLYGVYCVSPTRCWAVGGNPNNNTRGSIVDINPTANTSDVIANNLTERRFGVTCADPNDCWSVGRVGQTYHYNGTDWTLFADIGATTQTVDCFNRDDCWAAGNSADIYHYNGTAWVRYVNGNGFTFRGIGLVGPKERPESFWKTL